MTTRLTKFGFKMPKMVEFGEGHNVVHLVDRKKKLKNKLLVVRVGLGVAENWPFRV